MSKPLTSRRVFRAVTLGVIGLTLLICLADIAATLNFVQISNSGPNAMSPRYVQTATLLQDGRVLMTGGDSNSGYVKTSYLFDPTTNAFAQTGDLAAGGRAYHTATLLPNGNVLVAGGFDNSGVLTTTRIYQPATGTFVAGPTMPGERAFHTATSLANGDVLLAGGFSNAGTMGSAAIYHWTTNTFTSATMVQGRYLHTAVLLGDGRAFIQGGFGDLGLTASAEVYDPATNQFTMVTGASRVRAFHTAVYLPVHNRVIVAGGASQDGTENSVEIYDPATDSWTPGTNLLVGVQGFTATDMGGGKVMFIGGLGDTGYVAATQIYDLVADTMTAGPNLATARYYLTATRLNSGNVLVSGGYGDFGPLNNEELYLLSPRTAVNMGAAVTPFDSAYGGTVDAAACVATSGVGIAGKVLRLNLGGVDLGTAITDAAGCVHITAQLSSTLTVSNNTLRYLTASFPDDGTYLGAAAASAFRVNAKATPTITVTGIGTFPVDGQPHAASAAVTGAFGESLGAAAVTYTDQANNTVSSVPPTAIGNYTVRASFVTNASYLAATKTAGTIAITPADTTPPVITANDITMEATSVAGAAVTLVFSAADDTDPTPVVTADHASGTFPLGNTGVIVTATDAAGNSNTKTFLVHVVDTTAPTIAAPADQTVEATSVAGATADPGTATGSDIAGAITISGGGVAGDYPLGTTTLTWTATDQAGHTASAVQRINVVDTTAPTIGTPADQTVEATSAAGATVDPGTAAGNDLAGAVTISGGGAAGNYPLGTTTLTWVATDQAGHIATAVQHITVVDTTAPAIVAPANQTVEATSAAGATVNPGTATGSDIAGAVTISGGGVAGAYPLGTTTLTWIATDQAGRTASAVQHITVVDTTAPTITVPADQTVEATSANGATVNPGTATGSDTAGTVTISGGGVAGNYPLGTTTLTWVATDQAGRTASAVQHITVVDTTAPTITAPADQTVEASSANGATVNPGTATGSDTAGTATISGGGVAGNYPLGTTTLTWVATDQAGHTASAVQHIVVADTTKPSLSLPSNISVTASSSTGAVVTFTASATDAVGGTVAVLCTPPSGSTFAIQQTTVTCSATDPSNNVGTGSFTVTVTSTDVTTPGQMRGEGYINQDGARYSFDFDVRETARGGERGSFELRVDETRQCDCRDNRGRKVKHGDRDDRTHDCRGNDRDDRFKARTIDAVAFTDDPTIRPGRRTRPQVDTVVFSGTGTWNGRGNYRFEARATDQGEPGRHREMLKVTVWDSNGNVVATVDGDLDGGNIQSRRLDHGRATRW